MMWEVAVFVGLLGVMVGSFANVVILRIHAGKTFTQGRSECPQCKHVLSPLELIPILSWIGLRGRCRHCHKPISPQYPLVEAVTALTFIGIYLHLDPSSWLSWLVVALWWYIATSLIILAVYDLRWRLLPDKVLLPIIAPAVAILVINALTSGQWSAVLHPLIAALAFGGAFYALAAVSDGAWMGGGDIKLAFVMGLLLGLQGTALAMMIAFVTAAVVGVALIGLGRKDRKDQIAFGPFLILGIFVAFMYGQPIINWYLGITGAELLLQV